MVEVPLSLLPSPPSGGIPVVVCHESKVKLLFKQADSCKTLRTIIRIGGSAAITAEEKALSKETGIAMYTIDDVIVSKKYCLGGKWSIFAESADFEPHSVAYLEVV